MRFCQQQKDAWRKDIRLSKVLPIGNAKKKLSVQYF
jgi:hypothetical protein